MDLKDKVAVVTGASRGLGGEIARLLAKEDCKLALVARNEESLKKLALELGEGSKYYICDITDDKAVKVTFQKIVKDFGRVDILVNGAGIWAEGKFEEHSLEGIRKLFEVNTLGAINCCYSVVPLMKEQRSGRILNVISVAGVETAGDMGPYSPYTATKYALAGFSKSLEEELRGTGIKVQAIFPGGMNTELFKTAGLNYKDNEDWMMDKRDVAKIVVYMLSQPEDVVIDHLVVRKFNK